MQRDQECRPTVHEILNLPDVRAWAKKFNIAVRPLPQLKKSDGELPYVQIMSAEHFLDEALTPKAVRFNSDITNFNSVHSKQSATLYGKGFGNKDQLRSSIKKLASRNTQRSSRYMQSKPKPSPIK
jgi:hypothetical protein